VARVPSLRASDTDREQIAERLRHATAEGRLDADELDERLGALYSSRTYGELDALVADLPAPTPPSRPLSGMPRWAPVAAAGMALLLVLGMFSGVHHTYAIAGHQQQFRVDGQFPPSPPHHALLVTAPIAGVLTILAIGAAVGWLLLRTRHATHG
jgi:hypothetical protein